MSLPTPVYAVASGHCHPERELSSVDLEASIPDLRDGWCEEYLGMKSRRVLGLNEGVASLSAAALSDALTRAEWAGTDLDAIVCGCTLTDQMAPASASFLAMGTNPGAIAFDVNASCAGFIYALSAAVGLLSGARGLSRAAVCVGEHATAWIDYTDRRSSVFWGDSGGALLITTDPPNGGHFEILDLELRGDHSHPEKVFVPRNGTFRSDGKYSFTTVLGLCFDTSQELMARNDVDSESVVALVAHQANERMLRELSIKLDIPYERQWHNFEWAGNQSAAGTLTAFSAGWGAAVDALQDGDHVILTAAGGGYAGGAALLEWHP